MVNLKAERRKAGLTQKQLGEKVGVTRTHIGNIETGSYRPSVEVAMAIAKILGFDWTLFYVNKDKV